MYIISEHLVKEPKRVESPELVVDRPTSLSVSPAPVSPAASADGDIGEEERQAIQKREVGDGPLCHSILRGARHLLRNPRELLKDDLEDQMAKGKDQFKVKGGPARLGGRYIEQSNCAELDKVNMGVKKDHTSEVLSNVISMQGSLCS